MNITSILWPKLCVKCSTPGSFLCKRCGKRGLQPWGLQRCHVCLHEARAGMVHSECEPSTYLDGVAVQFVYGPLVETLVARVKYGFAFKCFEPLLSSLNIPKFPVKVDYICPVPLHPYKVAWRGFNQAEMIAYFLAKLANIQASSLLERSANTSSQVGKLREQRLQNLQSVFQVLPGIDLKNKVVVVVDDVMTTGTTLEQCAKALKLAGAAQVFGFVLARSLRVPTDLENM